MELFMGLIRFDSMITTILTFLLTYLGFYRVGLHLWSDLPDKQCRIVSIIVAFVVALASAYVAYQSSQIPIL